jgi:hypothetical protein
MLKTGRGVAASALMAVGIGGTSATAQKGGKPRVGSPSEGVFADSGEAGTSGADQLRSDRYETVLCHKDGEPSRYCGGTFTDPETGLTYGGVGRECPRINARSSDYAFRTLVHDPVRLGGASNEHP